MAGGEGHRVGPGRRPQRAPGGVERAGPERPPGAGGGRRGPRQPQLRPGVPASGLRPGQAGAGGPDRAKLGGQGMKRVDGLWTTSVGSLPKPDSLLAARGRQARGEISAADLDQLSRKATQEWISFQEEIGVDVLVDGEMYRGDMVAYFAENLEGMALSGLVRSYGNRYYKKPVAVGSIRRPRPITVAWWEFAQGLTDRPVKGMLTGPYTLCDWSFDDHYGSRRELVLAFAKVVRQEAHDLERAGAQYIQIDEPAVSTRLDELDLAIEAMGVVTEGLKAHTITHMCYGRFEEVY